MIFEDIAKSPKAVLDYSIDWADGGANDGSGSDPGWLQGDTIATSTWTITAGDGELVIDSETESTTATTIWLSGGTLNTGYLVENFITTPAGREETRTVRVRVVIR